jgi:hypothetical protein
MTRKVPRLPHAGDRGERIGSTAMPHQFATLSHGFGRAASKHSVQEAVMSNAGYFVWFICMTIAIALLVTIGTLAAAGLLIRPRDRAREPGRRPPPADTSSPPPETHVDD